MKQTMCSNLTNTKIIVIKQILRQLTLHSHIATHAKRRAPDTSTRWNQATASLRKQFSKEFLTFSYLSVHYQDFGTPPRFSYGNKHQSSFKTNPLKAETRLLAPAGLAASSDFSPSFSPCRSAPRGLAASGHCPGPPPLPGGRGRAGAYITGEGAAVRARGGGRIGSGAAGAGEGTRAALPARLSGTFRAPARTDPAALPSLPAAPVGEQPAEGGRSQFQLPALTPPPPHPALLLRHLQTLPAPHLSNAPAHWATPPARSRALIGRLPLPCSFPPALSPSRWRCSCCGPVLLSRAGSAAGAAARGGEQRAAPRAPCPAGRAGTKASRNLRGWFALPVAAGPGWVPVPGGGRVLSRVAERAGTAGGAGTDTGPRCCATGVSGQGRRSGSGGGCQCALCPPCPAPSDLWAQLVLALLAESARPALQHSPLAAALPSLL